MLDSKIIEYLNQLYTKHKSMYAIKYPNLTSPTFKNTNGKKFIKIIICNPHESVHCFIDKKNGDIYKAASFKAPAKGIRGNLHNVNVPIFCGDFYSKRM